MCFVEERIKFRRPDGKRKSINFQNVFYYFGTNVDAFAKEFERWGKVASL
jgi:hypothetical protein